MPSSRGSPARATTSTHASPRALHDLSTPGRYNLRVTRHATLLLSLLTLAACDDDPAEPRESLRGDRYCEILIGTLDLEAGAVAVDVYNTYGLNDCPADAWATVDAEAVKAATGADAVILNGPRYWVFDEFEQASLIDPTVRTLGGIEMRKAGALVLPLAEVGGAPTPYLPRTVRRTTTWRYHAGQAVYELVDPDGAVFDMQSYSTQQVAQAEADLATLADVLAPPAGWSFRSRVLAQDLDVTAVDGSATVVQDERGNTYQRSQQ